MLAPKIVITADIMQEEKKDEPNNPCCWYCRNNELMRIKITPNDMIENQYKKYKELLTYQSNPTI